MRPARRSRSRRDRPASQVRLGARRRCWLPHVRALSRRSRRAQRPRARERCALRGSGDGLTLHARAWLSPARGFCEAALRCPAPGSDAYYAELRRFLDAISSMPFFCLTTRRAAPRCRSSPRNREIRRARGATGRARLDPPQRGEFRGSHQIPTRPSCRRREYLCREPPGSSLGASAPSRRAWAAGHEPDWAHVAWK